MSYHTNVNSCKHCLQVFDSKYRNKIFCTRRCKEKFYNKEQYRQQKIKLNRKSIIENVCRICKNNCNNFEEADPLCKLCYMYIFKRKGKSLSIETEDVLNDIHLAKTRERRFLDGCGYVKIKKEGHSNSKRFGRILEHVFVMSEHLGRPIRKGETIHHINGIKTDNRIENLELWISSHPPGQRVEDKIKWAKEFLEGYGYKVEK